SELGDAVDEAPSGALAIVAGTGLLSGESVLSKRDGTFEVRGLAAGAWKFSAQHRDFAFSTSEPIQVAAGATVEGVEIALSSGGGLEGRITDRHDRPLPGAIVVAASPAGLTGSREGGDLYQGVADASGHYQIAHMQGGGYFVAVLRGDAALSPMSFLGTLQFDLVTVPTDAVLEYDIIDRSAAACRVYGQVLAGGAPAAAGGIFALSFEGEGMLGLEVKIAQVRSDGTYEFPGLAPGAYQFNYGGAGRGGDAQMRVNVPDLPEYKCDLALPEGRIAGRVIACEGGAPVRGAQVLLRSKEDRAPTGLLAQLIGGESRGERASTRDDGSFEFERVSPGSYALEVQPPRWGDDRGKYAPRTGDSVEIADGEVRTDLEFALSPSWAIRGRVTGDGGQPQKGATVLAYARATPELEPSRATTSAEGEFELLSLAEGRHELLVWADGYAEKRVADVKSAQGPQSVEIALERGFEIRVRALDALGQPLAGAVAKVVPLDSAAGVSADARRAIGGFLKGQGMSGLDGWMELGRFMPGRYRIEATRGTLRGAIDEVGFDGYGGTAMESSITLK
ncbi:MAG: carboxypeptidase regulatory-like domain-containing protein, partial [Planctomycetota bacterium]